MKPRNNILHIFLCMSLSQSVFSQDTLRLTKEACEARFLQENLVLLAEKLEVSKAEALVLQAKTWPNPRFSVEEFNLWAGNNSLNNLSVFDGGLPGVNGSNFGRNQQLGLSVEQLILTAGKRRKLVELEQVNVAKSNEYLEDLLRNLKWEVRSQITQLQSLQMRQKLFVDQINSVKRLSEGYKKQVQLEHISKGEWMRLKAHELELIKALNELNSNIIHAQNELKLLLRLPANSFLEISLTDWNRSSYAIPVSLENLISQAKQNRSDLKIASLEKDYFGKLLAYEKAQRVPNLSVSAIYDRGGNFIYNFFGMGLAIDIPVFDRNQGNILHAQKGIEQQDYLLQYQEIVVESETEKAYRNLLNAIEMRNQIEQDYENSLDQLLVVYTKNFTERNISMLEFLDFLEAYMDNKNILIDSVKEVNDKVEELNYTVGKEVI